MNGILSIFLNETHTYTCSRSVLTRTVCAYDEAWGVDMWCLDCAKRNNISIQQLHILLTSPQQWHHQNVKGHTTKNTVNKIKAFRRNIRRNNENGDGTWKEMDHWWNINLSHEIGYTCIFTRITHKRMLDTNAAYGLGPRFHGLWSVMLMMEINGAWQHNLLPIVSQ